LPLPIILDSFYHKLFILIESLAHLSKTLHSFRSCRNCDVLLNRPMILGNKKDKKSNINPLVIVLFAGIVIGFYGIYNIYKGYESQSWPTTEGKIIDSRIAGAKRTIGRRVFINYEYFVKGKRYVSSQISYTLIIGDYSGSIEILREYPKGKIVTVYYNPDNSIDAVLKTEISGRISWLFILSVLAIILGLRGWKWQRF
jgi:hypothetical protein